MSEDAKNKSGGKHTLVEAGSTFKGTLESSCPIVVLGKLEGEVSGPSLEVREGGRISGRVKVTELTSRGELAGTIEADTVALAGRVQDQSVIRAKSLEVNLDGAAASGQDVLFGDCELCIGEELVKEVVISEAAASRRAAEHPAPPPPPAPAPSPEAPPVVVASSEGAPAPEPGRRRRNTASTHVDLEPTTPK